MARQTTDRGIGEDDLDGRARALAERFHGNCEQILLVLQKLAKELPSLDASKPDLDYVAGIVCEALLTLPCEQALELLQVSPAGDLEERIWVAHYLCGERDDGDLPLFSRDELAATIESFSVFLAGQRMHLLETGLPSDDFARCRWLDDRLARLYPIRRTKVPSWDNRPANFPRMEFPRGLLRAQSDADGPETVAASYDTQNGDLVTSISMADAERLISLRPKILDLKLYVLDNVARFLRLPKRGDSFWNVCFSHVRAELRDDDVIFWTRMDAIYADDLKMWKAAAPFVSSMTGYVFPFPPGGLTDIIELIGHVEKECAIGTMHETRKALGDLVAIEESGPRLLATGPWPYFELVGLQEQPKLDEAIRVFQECADREADFWPDFRNRVEKDLAGGLKREVIISLRAEASVADALGPSLQEYASWVKNRMSAASDRVLSATLTQEVTAEPLPTKRYILDMNGTDWEIQFGTGRPKPLRNLDGLLYLRELLCNPQKPYSATELGAIVQRFRGNQESRSVRPQAELRDTSTVANDAGELIDARARSDYEKRLREIAEEIPEARRTNDQATIDRLKEEAAVIEEVFRPAINPHGRIVRQSSDRKKAQDRVRNAIDRAINAIRKKDANLARHLMRTVDSRPVFRYDPRQDETIEGEPAWNR